MGIKMSPADMRIGIVVSRFNEEITEKLKAGAISALEKRGVPSGSIRVLSVPGALEIPVAAQALLETGADGVVVLGAVIRGETTHYDYVCSGVERGCSNLQLQYKKPIGFGVLTTENEHQALERAGGSYGNKGFEAAEVTVEMVQLLKQIY